MRQFKSVSKRTFKILHKICIRKVMFINSTANVKFQVKTSATIKVEFLDGLKTNFVPHSISFFTQKVSILLNLFYPSLS